MFRLSDVVGLVEEVLSKRLGVTSLHFVNARDRLFHHCLEFFVGNRPTGRPEQGKVFRKVTLLIQVKQRWVELALGQVTGGPE